jgi:hypothetical protein
MKKLIKRTLLVQAMLLILNFSYAQKIRTLNLKFVNALCHNEGTGEPVYIFKNLKDKKFFRLEQYDFNNAQNHKIALRQLEACLEPDCKTTSNKCAVKGKDFILTQQYVGKDEIGIEIWKILKLQVKQ